MKILDATCGFKGIWYQKNHPFVTFLDIRQGHTQNTKRMKFKNRRHFKLNPNVIADFKFLPFVDDCFDMVIFDPPHYIVNTKKEKSILELRYGYFYESEYKSQLKHAFSELFRVLKYKGIFIFKWCEIHKKLDEILPLIPYTPLFGSRVGQKNNTHWIVFIKHRLEKDLFNP